jgi:hypothetical protein
MAGGLLALTPVYAIRTLVYAIRTLKYSEFAGAERATFATRALDGVCEGLEAVSSVQLR